MSDASSSSFFVVLDPSRNNARRVRGARALLLLASAFPLAPQLFDFVHDSDGDASHSRTQFIRQILTRSISAVLRYTRSPCWAVRRMSESSSSSSFVQAHQCVQVGKNFVCSNHLSWGGGRRRSRNQIYDESHPKKSELDLSRSSVSDQSLSSEY